MKLLSATIRNYRVHRETTLSLDAPLVMIHGPNESGKSTLVEALHCALFLKAKGSTSLHEAMESNHGGPPEVELRFSARGQVHLLRKSFGRNGQTTLETTGKSTLTGTAAEEALASLLDVDGALSGGGIENKMLQRWGHLWVWQGKSSETPLDSLTESQHKLRDKLQPANSPTVLSSPLDNAVIDHLQAWQEENFTTTGRAKAGSPLEQAEKALAGAREYQQKCQTKLTELSQAASTYQQAVADLQRYRQSLQEAEAQLQIIREKLKNVETRRARYAEKNNLRQTAEKILADQRDADIKIREMETKLDQATAAAAPATTQLNDLEEAARIAKNELDQAHRQREESARNLSQKRREADAWQAHVDALRETRRIDDLTRSEAKIRELQRQRQELRAKLAPLDAFSAPALKKLLQANLKNDQAKTRLQAFALEVELLASPQNVKLDGQDLTPSQPRTLSRAGELTIGADTRIRLTPGGAADLDQARQAAEQAAGQLDDLLRQLAVPSLETAEQKRRERESLEQNLDKIETPLSQSDPEKVTAELHHATEARARYLARRDNLLASDQAPPFPSDPTVAASAFELAQQALSKVEDDNAKAEETEKAARKKAQQAEQAWTESKSAFEQQNKNIADLTSRLAYAIEQTGDQEARTTAINAARATLDQALAAENNEKEELEKLGADQLELDQLRLEKSTASDKENIRSAERRQIESQSTLSSNGTTDPERDLKEAEADLLRAEQHHQTLHRQGEVRLYLLKRLQAARKEATDALTKPLEEAVTPYLQNIFGASRARIRWSADSNALDSFELDRTTQSGGLFPFAQLSHGTREQAGLALRLAMAGILAQDHDQCLPLVLDDAFTHADRQRIEKLKTLLFQGSQKGLQIILLTCHPENYNGLGAHEVNLPSSR